MPRGISGRSCSQSDYWLELGFFPWAVNYLLTHFHLLLVLLPWLLIWTTIQCYSSFGYGSPIEHSRTHHISGQPSHFVPFVQVKERTTPLTSPYVSGNPVGKDSSHLIPPNYPEKNLFLLTPSRDKSWFAEISRDLARNGTHQFWKSNMPPHELAQDNKPHESLRKLPNEPDTVRSSCPFERWILPGPRLSGGQNQPSCKYEAAGVVVSSH